FLLGPAMAQHGLLPRRLPAVRDRARADAVPARRSRPDRRARADPAADLVPRARPGLLRTRPRPAHRAAPAPAPGLPRRRAPPPPPPPAHRAALGPAAPGRRRAHQRPDRPPPGHLRGNRAHPPGTHLPPAAGLQPDRRRHPRLPQRPDTPRSPVLAAARPAACSPSWPEPCACRTGLALHSPLMICRLWRGWTTTGCATARVIR